MSLVTHSRYKSDRDVESYESARYSDWNQRVVDRRERALVQRVLAAGPGRGPLVALDVPCGYGRLAPTLSELGYRLLWADLSVAMARRVAGRPERQGRPAPVVASLAALPIRDRAVDLLVSMRMFQHVQERADRVGMLREAARVTRRWSMISFYDRRSVHGAIKRLSRILQGRQTKLYMSTREAFAEEAREAGFTRISFHALARSLHAQTLALLER